MKAKNVLFSIFSVIIVWWFASTYAVNVDSQIDDALNQKAGQEMQKKVQDLNEKITFTKVKSCQSMESVMSGFLETYRKLHPKRNYNYGWDEDYLVEDISWEAPIAVTNWAAMKSADAVRGETSQSASLSAEM